MTRSSMTLGKSADGEVTIDLPKLLETRMLVQSNSGGGKSWALRRLLEQTAPAAQQIIIDVEGEFTTLREKFDYVICAPQGGDAAATPQTAPVLARKLRELRVSAIIDIHDLKADERQAFVQRFFDALMQSPRDHWNPALIVLDEAHLFAPEQNKAESTSAVIDIATRGRKRGLSLIAATQRLSKLHKDVAAELLNKLVGRTGLDVDVRRAADELGMTGREAIMTLRELNPGDFYAFGPALTRSVTKVTIGAVQTTHPKVGDRLSIKTPAPSRKVLSVLQELAEIPREAETEAVTVEALRAENATLKRKLTNQAKVQQGIPEKEVQARVSKAVEEAARKHQETLQAIAALVGVTAPKIPKAAVALSRPAPSSPSPKTTMPAGIRKDPGAESFAADITSPQQRVLDAMAKLTSLGLTQLHKTQVAAIAGVSPNSGTYANNLGRLRTMGMIEYPQGGYVAFTSQGEQAARFPSTPATPADLHQAWLEIVTGPQQKIIRALIKAYPQPLSKADLAVKVEVTASSGTFANNLGRLRTLGALDYPRPGYVRAHDLLFPLARQD